jgi:hypothetical protein
MAAEMVAGGHNWTVPFILFLFLITSVDVPMLPRLWGAWDCLKQRMSLGTIEGFQSVKQWSVPQRKLLPQVLQFES